MLKNKKIYILILILLFIVLGLLLLMNIKKTQITFLKTDPNLGTNIYSSNLEYSDIYNINTQKAIHSEVKTLLTRKNTFENPLIIYNCYGTNKLSFNVYFYDAENLHFNYEISTPNSTLSKKVHIVDDSKLYAFQVIGLEEGEKNQITISSSDNRTYSFELNVPEYDIPTTTVTSSTENNTNLSDGFFTYLGMQKDNYVSDVYLVDNNAIVRGIIPLKGNLYSEENSTVDRLFFYNDHMFYNISSNQIAKVNNLGKVEDIYLFDGYNKHHDFTIDKENDKLLILASENNSTTMEDIILIYDLKTKKMNNVIDLKTVLDEIYAKADKAYTNSYSKGKIDWIHINSIDLKNNQLLLSSRELSSIICLSDAYTTPKLSYILGDKKMYENTSYYDLVYNQSNDFIMHLGQHTAYFYNDNNYIALYNNNYAVAPIVSWFDWNTHANEKMEKSSFLYLYKVNHNDKTYELVNEIEVPYSSIMSSTQILENNNKVIFSYLSYVFGEYDDNNNLIASYKIDRSTYRIHKYDFKGFWFE